MRISRRTPLALPLGLLLLGATAATARAQEAAGVCTSGPPLADLRVLDLEDLMRVQVVTASKTSEDLADAPGVVSVVGRDELARFGGTTLRDVLERVPGLLGSTAYFTDRSMVSARGDQAKINGGHVLFLVDGRPTREVLEGGLVSDLLESFPISVLDRVEVVKGPGSVLYGSNAFSAIVNLITVVPDRNGFSVSAAPGPDGARRLSGEGTLACGDLRITGGGQVHEKPDWSTPYRFISPIPDDPLAEPVPVLQQAAIRDRSRGGFLDVSFRGLRAMSAFTEWRTSSFVRGTIGESHWRRGFADVGYELQPADSWTTQVNFTYTRNLFGVDAFPHITRDSHESVLEWTNVIAVTARDRLTVGALYNHIGGQETYHGLGFPLEISNARRHGSATYAQLDHRLTDAVKLIGGVQANKIGSLAIDVVPRGGAIWRPAARVNVKALYGQAFRAPSINETTLNHPGLTGTPGLRPEKVATVDLELSYEGDRVQASANYFHSRHTDSIVVDVQPLRWAYRNLGEATFQGVELQGRVYVTRRFLALGSYLYQANEDGDGVSNITPVPNTAVKAGLSYQGDRGLTLSAFDNFQGALPGFTSILNPVPESYHMLSGHARLELGELLRTSWDSGLSLVVDAENLTNHEVWLPAWGDYTGDTIPGRRGRTVYVGVEMAIGGRISSRATATN